MRSRMNIGQRRAYNAALSRGLSARTARRRASAALSGS